MHAQLRRRDGTYGGWDRRQVGGCEPSGTDGKRDYRGKGNGGPDREKIKTFHIAMVAVRTAAYKSWKARFPTRQTHSD